MKKICWLMIWTGMLTAAGILYQEWKPERSQISEIQLTFIAPKTWNRIASGTMQADKDFGTNTKFILYSQEGVNEQTNALKYAWMSGTDGIITGGMEESEETEELIRRIQKDGVPVVFVDSDLPGSTRECYFGSNNYEVGYLAGEALKEKAQGAVRICLILSYEQNESQKERVKGLKEAIADSENLQITEIIEGKSEALVIREQLTKALEEDPQINAIVCAEGVSINCCGQVLKDNGLSPEDYVIIGMHYSQYNTEAVRFGEYDAVIWQNQYQMGYEAVRYLKDLYDGKTREEKNWYTNIDILDKENIEEIVEEEEDAEWYIF